ncbi:MAG: zinc-binding dehydrogenase [Crocinitomicaceae bacterium]|nr:zinc-binding dehydrogenase [Crocinitomicaceae bacterium]
MKTTAYSLVKKGKAEQAFQLNEIELPALKENEVIIEVASFGINYADVMARNGLYREAPPMPCVLGYEVVGTVIEVGKLVDTSILQKRVVGFTRFGGYAKHAITTKDAIVEIGDIPTSNALSLATQGVTAYYMANYSFPIRAGENVLIHAAAGGVGTLLIQLSKQAGATVFAKVSSAEKQEKCHSLGADYTINYKSMDYQDKIESLIGTKRIDVSFNPVGGDTFKKDRALMGFGSRMVLFGGSQLSEGRFGIFSQLNFLRKMGRIIPAFMMMQSKSLIGVNMLKIADSKPEVLNHCMKEMVKLYQDGKIVTENGGEYAHSSLAEAHTLLESGKSIGKITIHW